MFRYFNDDACTWCNLVIWATINHRLLLLLHPLCWLGLKRERRKKKVFFIFFVFIESDTESVNGKKEFSMRLTWKPFRHRNWSLSSHKHYSVFLSLQSNSIDRNKRHKSTFHLPTARLSDQKSDCKTERCFNCCSHFSTHDFVSMLEWRKLRKVISFITQLEVVK